MAAWKSTGHLFQALEQCGASALWLRVQLLDEEFKAIFEPVYLATQRHSRESADDMEIALFFDLYPDWRPQLLEAVKTVGLLWARSRVLTLRGLMRRKEEPGGEAIRARLELCKADRRAAAEDVAESLWLTSPALAATIAARQAGNRMPLASFLIRSQVDAQRALAGELMDGLE